MDKEKQGCGKFIKNELTCDDNAGWICGQYYDALKKKIFCEKCMTKEKTLSDAYEWKGVSLTKRKRFYPEENVKNFIKRVEKRLKEVYTKPEDEPIISEIFKEEFGEELC